MLTGGGLEQRLRRELEKRPHFAVVLPLAEPADALTSDAVIDSLRSVVAHSGAVVQPHPLMRRQQQGEKSGWSKMLSRGAATGPEKDFFVVISEIALWIAVRDTPVELYGDVTQFVNPETWPKGGEALKQHAAHVEICDLDMLRRQSMPAGDAAFNRAVAVTAAAAAMARLAPPLALLWHPARAALPPTSFRDQFGRALAGKSPLELWMRWFLLRGGEGETPGVITRGLHAFVGREIEVRPSARPQREALTMAFAAASLLVDHRGQLKDGETVTILPGLSANVRVGSSRARAGLPVFELTPVPPAAKRGDG